MKQLFKITSLVLVACVALAGTTFAQRTSDSRTIKKLKKSLQSSPTNTDLRNKLVNLYYEQALEDLKSNEAKEAVLSLQEGLTIGMKSGNALADNSEAILKIRYALGYGLMKASRPMDAIPVIDSLVSSAPDNNEAKYLLGVSLVRTMTDSNTSRGLEVLKQLGSQGGEGLMRLTGETSARLAINTASMRFANGDATGANSQISLVSSTYGDRPSNSSENNHFAFSKAVYKTETGEAIAAVAELEDLETKAPRYKLSNGVALKIILANTYYRAAVENLGQGGAAAGDRALKLLVKAEAKEGSKVAEFAHAKAQAYAAKGDEANAKKAMDELKEIDSAYFNKVSKKS